MAKLDFHHFQVRHFNNIFEQSLCHCRVGATSASRSNYLQTRRMHHQVKYRCLNAHCCTEDCVDSTIDLMTWRFYCYQETAREAWANLGTKILTGHLLRWQSRCTSACSAVWDVARNLGDDTSTRSCFGLSVRCKLELHVDCVEDPELHCRIINCFYTVQSVYAHHRNQLRLAPSIPWMY